MELILGSAEVKPLSCFGLHSDVARGILDGFPLMLIYAAEVHTRWSSHLPSPSRHGWYLPWALQQDEQFLQCPLEGAAGQLAFPWLGWLQIGRLIYVMQF